jgi:hypothetical protein
MRESYINGMPTNTGMHGKQWVIMTNKGLGTWHGSGYSRPFPDTYFLGRILPVVPLVVAIEDLVRRRVLGSCAGKLEAKPPHSWNLIPRDDIRGCLLVGPRREVVANAPFVVGALHGARCLTFRPDIPPRKPLKKPAKCLKLKRP